MRLGGCPDLGGPGLGGSPVRSLGLATVARSPAWNPGRGKNLPTCPDLGRTVVRLFIVIFLGRVDEGFFLGRVDEIALPLAPPGIAVVRLRRSLVVVRLRRSLVAVVGRGPGIRKQRALEAHDVHLAALCHCRGLA